MGCLVIRNSSGGAEAVVVCLAMERCIFLIFAVLALSEMENFRLEVVRIPELLTANNSLDRLNSIPTVFPRSGNFAP
jgi:hypothetical protein